MALRTNARRRTPVATISYLVATDIRRYTHATGDFNPLWLDDAYARAAGYRGRLVPPLLVGWVPFSLKEGEYADDAFDLRRALPLPAHYTNVRNAGTEIEWLAPVYFGEELTVQTRLVDVVARHPAPNALLPLPGGVRRDRPSCPEAIRTRRIRHRCTAATALPTVRRGCVAR